MSADETLQMHIRELTVADREAATGLWEKAGLTRPWNKPVSDFDRALGGLGLDRLSDSSACHFAEKCSADSELSGAHGCDEES